jgi:hypothetical protein
MTPQFSQYINKTILVSIPVLFHDEKCRPYKLIGVEGQGLWLQSDELTTRLLPEHLQDYAAAGPVVFVPFDNIAGILIATLALPAKAPPTAGARPVTDPKASGKNPASTAKSGTPEKATPPQKPLPPRR